MNRTRTLLTLALLAPLPFALLGAANAGVTKTAAVAQETRGAYLLYSQAAYDAAGGKARVLFFHAGWCPTCRAADKDLNANLAELPKNVVVFKVDYDKERALKRQYNVTYQHTFVLVDDKGEALKTWSGGGAKEIAENARAAVR